MNFFNQSLWLDEATTALVSKMSISDVLTKFLPGDFHPPLYYFFMHYWVGIFGSSEILLRLPSYIFAILTIYIVYKMSGKLAAALLATSGLFIYYAGEARAYMLVTFLVSLLIYSFIKKKWFWFSILLALVGMTDYVALFVLPVFWLAGWKQKKQLMVSHFPLVASYLIWFPVLVKQFKYGISVTSSSWGTVLGGITLKNILLIPAKFLVGRISFDNKLLYGAIVALSGLLIGYLLLKSKKALKIFWAWLIIPILVGVVISFKIPTLTYFRYLFCLPALYILISKTSAPKYLVYAVLFLNLLSTVYYILTSGFYREDWRSAAAAIGQDRIVFPAASQTEALVYYGKGDQIINSKQISKYDNAVWLSRYVWELFDPNDTTRVDIEKLGYNKTSEYNFNGVVFWKYQK